MKKILLFTTFSLILLALNQQCVRPPDYPDEPVITFKSMSKNRMFQRDFGPDSLTVTFTYTDGDGDLGFEDTTRSIFIIDGRDSFAKPPLQLPFVGTVGVGNGISGEISILIENPCCIFPPQGGIVFPPCDTSDFAPAAFDTLTFLIYIRDRAGHKSNQIATEPIQLVCRR